MANRYRQADTAASTPRHGFLGPVARPMFGCYHPPAQGASASGIAALVCGPHGAEALNAHRSLRALAEALAAQGTPALRVDLDGCGDAAGDDLDPHRVEAWLSSIGDAVQTLREQSGCARVVLIGVQLGALLCARWLQQQVRPQVAAWVGIAPSVSGRQFLRERLALGGLRNGHQEADAADAADAVLEAGGFAYTRATRDALSLLALGELGQAPGEVPLIAYQRADLPLPARLRGALGARLEVHGFDGYAAMVDEAHRTEVPRALIDALCQRIGPLAASAAGAQDVPVACLRSGPARWDATAHWDAVVEQPVYIGRRHLFGLLSLPRPAQPVRGTLLILNAGALSHVGPGRLSTHLARRWAAQGIAVLRLDLGGLGDSPTGPGHAENTVYGVQAVDEVKDAAAWLAQATGVSHCQVLGLCSGAYHAFRAAVGEAAVSQVLMLNPLTFFHPPGAPAAAGPGAHAMQAVGAAMARGWRSPAQWRRLVRGDLPWGLVASHGTAWLQRRLGQRWMRMQAAAARLCGRPREGDVVHALRSLALREVPVHLVFSQGEPGWALLQQLAGRLLRRLQTQGAVQVHWIEEADHVFTTLAARDRLVRRLDSLVLACAGPMGPATEHASAPTACAPGDVQAGVAATA